MPKMPTLAAMKKEYLLAVDAYYNEEKPIMSDKLFDALEKEIRKQDPTWDVLKKTGTKVKKQERPLKHFMPSLHKLYPETVGKWLAKQPSKLLWMAKLDGASLQLEVKNGQYKSLLTRGDGEMGGDISFLLPHLKLPKPPKQDMVMRCEAVMRQWMFKRKYELKYENARNMVNGWLNRMQPTAGLKDVSIVVLGVYGHSMDAGLDLASRNGFEVVTYAVCKDTPAHMLQYLRKECDYECDGIVICEPTRILEYKDADKPKWIRAYKENDEENATKAEVVGVIWQASRNRRWIPKIEIEPTRMDGVTVRHATLHNAKWMIDRGIGPGAVVELVRSGGVIPKIVGVKKKAKPSMPDGDYEWDGVHLMQAKASDETNIKAVARFFAYLGVEHLAEKTVEKIYHAYGGMTIPTALTLTADAMQEAGVGDAMSKKIYAEMKRVFKTEGVLLRDLMVASNCFGAGIGDRKLKTLEKEFGLDILLDNDIDDLNIHGFGPATVQLIKDGVGNYRAFHKKVAKLVKIKEPEVPQKAKSSKLKGEYVTFTGYRDDAEKQWVIENGGEVIDYGKRTTILLYRDTGKKSAKLDAARTAGVRVIQFKALKGK